MRILVNTKNEQDEKVLLVFLDSLNYNYRSNFDDEFDRTNTSFYDQYNNGIAQADLEIENGDCVKHEDVEKLFLQRRKVL